MSVKTLDSWWPPRERRVFNHGFSCNLSGPPNKIKAMEMINWNGLVNELAPALYRYFTACFSQAMAEDCVQETLLRFAHKFERGHFDESKGSPRMYAYGIARFVKLEALREKRRDAQELNEKQTDSESLREHGERESEETQNLRIQKLRAAISNLNEIQQEVLTLYLEQELTYEEIGGLLDIPINTIKSHIHRAKEALKNRLSKEGE